jgi:GT2 family glycosyltransferase
MKICAVTVTYGNRAGFCIRISEQAFVQGIHHLVIVDNGSEEESREKLEQFSVRNPSVQLIKLVRNTGSAQGFTAGIEAFLASDCDFILFLDDDNLLGQGALEKMVSFWNEIEEKDKEGNIALAAFRKNRPNMIAALQSGNEKFILPAGNSFMGFHIKLVWQFIRQRIKQNPSFQGNMREFMEIGATAYGGLWMHRQLCRRIGFPDISYVLYMDDFAYTLKIRSAHGKIILLRDSIIEDIQDSYYLPVKKNWLYHSVLHASRDTITYFTCRNVIYFSKKYLITNPFVYQMNKLIYFGAVFMIAILSRKFKKLEIIFKAARDGESNHMGLNKQFPL